MALLASGCTTWTWGYGNGSQVPVADSPQWAAVSVGAMHTCRIDVSKALYCDGAFDPNAEAAGPSLPAPGPLARIGNASWRAADSGTATVCGIQLDDSLWCWGDNAAGQVGDGTTSYRIDPVEVGAGQSWSAVSVGSVHACATTKTSELWCWGSQEHFQTGSGVASTQPQLTPIAVDGTDWATPVVGEFHSCGVTTDRTVWCWGTDVNGSAGLGDPEWNTSYPSPTQLGAAAWSVLDASWLSSCGVRTDGTLWCWGGLGPEIEQTPTQVGVDDDWVHVAVGITEACAIKADRSLWCWGYNQQGQVGDGTTETRLLPVEVGRGQSWFTVDVGWNTTEALALPS